MKAQNLAVLFISFLLSVLAGCSTTSAPALIPITLEDGTKYTIVDPDQTIPDFLASVNSMRFSYIVKGDVTKVQLANAENIAKGCRIYAGRSTKRRLVGVIAQGIVYGVASGVGVGMGAAAITGAKPKEYRTYGATAGAFSGIASGIVMLGGRRYDFDNCGANAFAMVEKMGGRVIAHSPW